MALVATQRVVGAGQHEARFGQASTFGRGDADAACLQYLFGPVKSL